MRKRHKKGSPEGGRFASDQSGKQPPSAGTQTIAAEGYNRTCQRCDASFVSQDHRWAQICPACVISTSTETAYVAFAQKATPLDLPGAPEEIIANQDSLENQDENAPEDDVSQSLLQYKGEGKFDYTLQEGVHYDIVQDEKNNIEFRRLNDEGRKEFVKLIKKLGPPLNWPTPVADFIEENGIPAKAVPQGRSSMEFHLVSILAAHPDYAFDRDDLIEFRSAYSAWYNRRPSVSPRPRNDVLNSKGDPIQQVNKTGQWGLQHQVAYVGNGKKPCYMLRQPYTYLSAARKVRDTTVLDPSDRDAFVERHKNFLMDNFINVPANEWDQGHTHPDDDSPTVWQPRGYQRSRRDRFIFDENGLVVAPTARELLNNPGKYYSPAELAAIGEALSSYRGGEEATTPLSSLTREALDEAFKGIINGFPRPA